MTAFSTEIGMGFVPISICWHTMDNNLIPGAALRAVLFKGAGNFVWIVAHALHCLLPVPSQNLTHVTPQPREFHLLTLHLPTAGKGMLAECGGA